MIPIVYIKAGYFGDYEILQNISRQFTYRAATDCIFYTVDSSDFKRLFVNCEDK